MAKQVLLREGGATRTYRVGPLARLNCAEVTGTPLADQALAEFKKTCEILAADRGGSLGAFGGTAPCAEKGDTPAARPKRLRRTRCAARWAPSADTPVAHVEAPRGVLIHDYQVD